MFRRAFTLVELLVTIAIIGVLVAMILPAVQAARESARRASCASHLSQLIIGIHQYEQAHLLYPPGTLAEKSPIENLPNDKHLTWIVHVLPYREQQVIYKNIDQSASVYDAKNEPGRLNPPKLIGCPSSSTVGRGYSDFAAAHHDTEATIDEQNNGVFFLNSKLNYDDLEDGASNTLFLGEKITDAFDLGWLSGTRATLRNGGTVVNYVQYHDGLPRPDGTVGYGNPQSITPESEPTKWEPPPPPEPFEPYPADGYYPYGPGGYPGAPRVGPIPPAPPSPYDPALLPPGVEPIADSELIKPVPPKKLPPLNDPKYVGGFGSAHPQGMNAAYGDGSVRFLSSTVQQSTLQALIHRKDGKLAQQP